MSACTLQPHFTLIMRGAGLPLRLADAYSIGACSKGASDRSVAELPYVGFDGRGQGRCLADRNTAGKGGVAIRPERVSAKSKAVSVVYETDAGT